MLLNRLKVLAEEEEYGSCAKRRRDHPDVAGPGQDLVAVGVELWRGEVAVGVDDLQGAP